MIRFDSDFMNGLHHNNLSVFGYACMVIMALLQVIKKLWEGRQ